jgi:C-terminal processing protease CtpA/Prc
MALFLIPAWGLAGDSNRPVPVKSSTGGEKSATVRSVGHRLAVRRIVRLLDSDRYVERMDGSERLSQLPPGALEAVLEAYRSCTSPEVRARIRAGVTEQVIRRISCDANSKVGFAGFAYVSTSSISQSGTRLVCELSVMVTSVLEGTPADLGGIESSDVILSIGDRDVADFAEADKFLEHLSSQRPGSVVPFEIERRGRRMTCMVTIGNRLTDAPAPHRRLSRLAMLEKFWDRLDSDDEQ